MNIQSEPVYKQLSQVSTLATIRDDEGRTVYQFVFAADESGTAVTALAFAQDSTCARVDTLIIHANGRACARSF